MTGSGIVVDEALVTGLVELGGYVHPLFTSPDPPLPGQALLLLLGGLVEQSGELDHARALLGFREVRFHSMVRAGDRLTCRISPSPPRESSSGSWLQDYEWSGVNQDGETVVTAAVTMLVNRPD